MIYTLPTQPCVQVMLIIGCVFFIFSPDEFILCSQGLLSFFSIKSNICRTTMNHRALRQQPVPGETLTAIKNRMITSKEVRVFRSEVNYVADINNRLPASLLSITEQRGQTVFFCPDREVKRISSLPGSAGSVTEKQISLPRGNCSFGLN